MTDPDNPNADDVDYKCPVTGFTNEEKEVLKQSWKVMIGTTQEEMMGSGTALLLWMLENVPDMRKVFKKFDANKDNENLLSDNMFRDHTKIVMDTLDQLVNLLPEPDILAKRVTALVSSHLSKTHPIGKRYFIPFRDKFHMFLNEALDLPKESQETKLWTAFLDTICKVMEGEEAKLGFSPVGKEIEGQDPKKGCCSMM